ncbi:MAG: CDP-alcohol phosphatidyltransferase family protein [Oscillospiraceae bacterium]|nr:CDP-alcohol phosphatidyltransferase family protein [Oscillospiraceae bacterium]
MTVEAVKTNRPAMIVVNFLSVSRILGSLALFLVTPMTSVFFVIYVYCIASDIADGQLARRLKVESNTGALLDSVADIAFIAAVLIILIPLLAFEQWMLALVAIVVGIRILTWIIGVIKFRKVSLIHTYANKISGLIMATFPILLQFLSLSVSIIIVFIAAVLAALDELGITIRAKELKRNAVCMFKL